MAAGSFFNTEAIQTLVAEHWNGTKWQVQATPIQSVNDSSFLTDVSCTQANSCTAVGASHNPLGHNQALVEDWSLRWHDQSPAFGFSVSDGGQAAVAETWNGTTWSVLGVPTFGGPPSGLSGVSCSSLTACISVGSDTDTSNREAPLAEQYS